jgi:hypothetical protein
MQPEAEILNPGPVQAVVNPTDTSVPTGSRNVPDQRNVRRNSAESTETEPRTHMSEANITRLAALLQQAPVNKG